MNFVLRRREKLRANLRYYGVLLLIAGSLIAAGVGPLYLRWWDAALPAAIATAIVAVILFAVIGSLPFEGFPYVQLYCERDSYSFPLPPRGFGRVLYRESARLDAMAREAGLTPLSEFESADPLDTKEAPVWHSSDDALKTVRHLLARTDPSLRPHLEYLHTVLQAMSGKDAKFYILVTTLAGGTNARVEALRHGDLSVLR